MTQTFNLDAVNLSQYRHSDNANGSLTLDTDDGTRLTTKLTDDEANQLMALARHLYEARDAKPTNIPLHQPPALQHFSAAIDGEYTEVPEQPAAGVDASADDMPF